MFNYTFNMEPYATYTMEFEEDNNNNNNSDSNSNQGTEEKLNNISPEGYKEYSVLEIKNIYPFEVNDYENFKQLSYYSKRDRINKILEGEEYITPYLETLIEYDDTNDKL